MSTVFHDDFNSASTVNLEARTPDVGTSYTKLTAGASATIAAGSGQAIFKDGARIAYTLNGVSSADTIFTSLLQWSGSGDILGMWFRRSGNTGPGLALNLQEGSNAALYYFNGSTYTPLTNGSGGTGTLGQLPSDGRFGQVTLTVSLIGNRLTCKLDNNAPFVDFTTNGQVTGGGNFQLEILSGENAILQWIDVDNNVAGGGGDTTPPTLSAGTATQTGTTTATIGATTNEGNGTLYEVVTLTNSAPTAAQVLAGQTAAGAAAPWAGNLAITAAGAKTLNATGLSPNTLYYAWAMHQDAAGNNSTVLAAGSFTTQAGATATVTSGQLKAWDGTLLGAATLTWLVIVKDSDGTTPVLKSSVAVNSSSIFSATDASLTAGTSYAAFWKTSTGVYGWGVAVAA